MRLFHRIRYQTTAKNYVVCHNTKEYVVCRNNSLVVELKVHVLQLQMYKSHNIMSLFCDMKLMSRDRMFLSIDKNAALAGVL